MGDKATKVLTVRELASRIAKQLDGRSAAEQERVLAAVAAMVGISFVTGSARAES